MSLTPVEAAGPEGESPSARRLFKAEAWLDWRDALAWEALPREMTRREYWAYIGVLVAAGTGYGAAGEHLPDWLLGLPDLAALLVLVAVAQLVWMGLASLARHRRARRRIPTPRYTVVEDWGDHLYLRIGPDEDVMVPETIRQVVQTPSHVFIEDVDGLAILPLRVCADPAAARALALRWDEASRAAQD